jgi:hypothetical protein
MPRNIYQQTFWFQGVFYKNMNVTVLLWEFTSVSHFSRPAENAHQPQAGGERGVLVALFSPKPWLWLWFFSSED